MDTDDGREERTAKDVVREAVRQARRLVDIDPAVEVEDGAPVERDTGGFLVRVVGLPCR